MCTDHDRRVQAAALSGTFQILSGIIESGQTFVDGLHKNRHMADDVKFEAHGGKKWVAVHDASFCGGLVVLLPSSKWGGRRCIGASGTVQAQYHSRR